MIPYSISLKNVKLPTGLELQDVVYELCTDGLFRDNDDSKISVVKDDEFKLDLDINLDFTDTDIYYCRVKLNFTDGSFKGWLRPVVVTKYSNSFTNNDSVIVTPEVKITTNKEQAELGGFKIQCSPFVLFTGNGRHKATKYKITDIDDETVWEVKYTESELTEVRVPSYVLRPLRFYKVEVVYISTTGMFSNKGVALLTTMGNGDVTLMPGMLDVERKTLERTLDETLSIAVNCLSKHM